MTKYLLTACLLFSFILMPIRLYADSTSTDSKLASWFTIDDFKAFLTNWDNSENTGDLAEFNAKILPRIAPGFTFESSYKGEEESGYKQFITNEILRIKSQQALNVPISSSHGDEAESNRVTVETVESITQVIRHIHVVVTSVSTWNNTWKSDPEHPSSMRVLQMLEYVVEQNGDSWRLIHVASSPTITTRNGHIWIDGEWNLMPGSQTH